MIVLVEVLAVFIVCGVGGAVLAVFAIVKAVVGEPSTLILLLAALALAWASSRGWYAFQKVRNASQPPASSQG
jgi:hypothetical protein